jgi:hypothetical protein
MESSTITPEAPEHVDEREPIEREPEQLYKFSTWVHLGPGAEDCSEGEKGECENRLHFHGWCRLPNPIQQRDIREKAMAAKARRRRQLKDPQTDAYEILEGDLDELASMGDAAREAIYAELFQQTFWADYNESVKDVKETEDEDGTLIYEHVEDDDKRFKQLQDTDPSERSEDELEELDRHLDQYATLVQEKLKERQQPRRDELDNLDLNALIDRLRTDRIGREAMAVFMNSYSQWEWYICTYISPGGRRRFADMDEVISAPPEVIAALRETYDELERMQREGVGKDS